VADDHVAVAQVVATQLSLRDIHIVLAHLVALRAEKANSLTHDLEDASADFQPLAGSLRLAQPDDERLLLETVGVLNAELTGGHAAKLRQRLVFEI
jgi:hypothetical protein